MGKGTTKTDNGNLAAKLALRRHFLAKYHADQRPYVLDCCAGSGVIWSELRGEGVGFDYWALDLKPKRGRLKMNSVEVLRQPGWQQTVVDIDVYGSPWKHWLAMLPNVVRPLTVFLTIGHVWRGGGFIAQEILDALGLGSLNIPAGIQVKVHDLALPYFLEVPKRHGLRIVEAAQSRWNKNARYVGVRLEPELVK